MSLFAYLFSLVFSFGIIRSSYKIAQEMSEIENGETAIDISPFLYKILYLNRCKPVRLLSVVYQIVITIPYILVQPFYLIYYMSFIGKLNAPNFLTIEFIVYLFLVSTIYMIIGYLIFDFVKKVTKPHLKIETTFQLYIPWKFLLLDTSIATIIITSMLCFEGCWNYALINIIIVLLLICIVAIGVRFTDKYSMNLEQLCGINGIFIRYKDIVKITVSERTLFWGLEKQTLIKIEDKNNTYYPYFTPKIPEQFINCLKKKCPDAEYIILDK